MSQLLPTHSFCQFTEEELLPWVIKKFMEHVETLDLLTSTDDLTEREIISVVALLDVDEDTLLSVVQNVPRDKEYIIKCRNNARSLLDATITV